MFVLVFFYFYFHDETLNRERAADDAFEPPREGSEVKKWEVVRGQTSSRFIYFFKNLSTGVKSQTSPRLSGRRVSLDWLLGVGMDVHVKEGQLYVQHQKFGKVSSKKRKKKKQS